MNLQAITGSGIVERKVKASEPVTVGSASYRAGDLLRVHVPPREGDDQASALVLLAGGKGHYVSFREGERVSIGEESWAISEIVELMLVAPEPPVELDPPYKPGTYLVTFASGQTTFLENVERIEDVSDWVWSEGDTQRIAVRPPEPVEAGP
jgi:hypothetical protein